MARGLSSYDALKDQIGFLYDGSPRTSVKSRSFSFPVESQQQMTLYDEAGFFQGYGDGIITFSGNFFERLTGARVGGTWHNQGVLSMENGNIQPDISNHKKRVYWEVKQCFAGEKLKLIRNQVERMTLWQLYQGRGVLPKVNFTFFVHKVPGLIKRTRTKSDLLDELRKGILYSVQVPLSLPLQFFLSSKAINKFNVRNYDYSNSAETRGFATCHIFAISPHFLDGMILDPSHTLEEMDLDPEDYICNKSKLGNLRVNGKRIHQFPFLEVIHRDFDKWLNNNQDSLRGDFLNKIETDYSELPLLNLGKDVILDDSSVPMGEDLEQIVKQTGSNSGFPWEEDNLGNGEEDEEDISF